MPSFFRSFRLPDSQWSRDFHRRLEDCLPPWALACVQLGRWDRPIGAMLLLWPCWWGTLFAWDRRDGEWLAILALMAAFALGAAAMRGAGCAWNDILDRDIDAMTARTQGRPLPSGRLSLRGAIAFMLCQLAAGAAVLWFLPAPARAVAVASLALVAIYPLMKRVTSWPQLFLGLTFNWGLLVGWTAVAGGLEPTAWILYLGAAAWTVGYDTIYAHQDREDDLRTGVGSTALLFGARSREALIACYGLTIASFAVAGVTAGMGALYYVFLAAAGAHFARQIVRLDVDDGDLCLRLFRSNNGAAALIFLAVALGRG